MNNKFFLSLVLVITLAIVLFPEIIMALDTAAGAKFGAKEFVDTGEGVTGFLFDYVVKFVCGIALAYAIMKALFNHNLAPLGIIFVLVSFVAFFRSFISGAFTLLLP